MKDKATDDTRILGDINPKTVPHPAGPGGEALPVDENDPESMNDGSEEGAPHHSGSRNVGGGGSGTEVGGTRNFRQGSGASGGDVGNRPE